MHIKRRIKWDKIIVILLLLFFTITLVISITKIILWKDDSNETKKQIDNINNSTDVVEIIDNENTEIIEPENEISEANPYWDYIKMKLIDVDFEELKKINKDVKGWVQINGINVNYPFVQASDNEYYLTRAFDKSYNKAGWVFLDYRNRIGEDKNTILYAHSRYDQTMFGSLYKTLKSEWYNNKENHVIKLSTETENTMWQVFSIYHIENTNDYLQVDFSSDQEYLEFLNKIANRSRRKFDTKVGINDTILTLSTCYIDDEKLAVHAKLIRKEKK